MVSALKTLGLNAFRDFEIPGVPASGRHAPELSAIRSWVGPVTDTAERALMAAAGGIAGYASVEDLPADLGPGDDGRLARVDGVGVFRWVSPEWVPFEDPVTEGVLLADGSNVPEDAEPLRAALDTPSRSGDGAVSLDFKGKLRIKSITPEDMGAAGDGVTDDAEVMNAVFLKAYMDRLIVESEPGSQYLIDSADLIHREGVPHRGPLAGAGIPGASNANLAAIWSRLPRFILGANRTIRLRGGASVSGVFTCRKGLNGQVEAHSAATRNAAFAGTHYTIEGEDTLIENALSLGAQYVWRNGGFSRARARDIRWDAMEGFQTAMSPDRGDWDSLHGWPFVTFGLGNQSSGVDHANYRPGVAYRISGTNDWLIGSRLFDYGHETPILFETHPNGSGPLTIQLDQCGFDSLAFPPSAEGEPESPWVAPGSKGIVVRGKADRVRISGATIAAKDLAIDIQLDDPNASVVISDTDVHGCRSGVKTAAGLTRIANSTFRGLNGAYGATIDQGIGLETTGNGRIVIDKLTTVEGFALARQGNDLPGSFIGAPMVKDGATEGLALHQVPIEDTTAQPSPDHDFQMLVGPPGATLGTLGPVDLTSPVKAFYFYNETVVLAGGNIFVEEDTTYYAAYVLLMQFVGNGWRPLSGYVDPPDVPPDPVEPPVNLAVPVISGTPRVGSALTASQGSWNPPGVTYAYQWKVAGVNVGTNSASYTPVSGDLGKTVTVTVTATNPDGSASATSAASAAVLAATGPITDYDTFVAAMTAKAYSGSVNWDDPIFYPSGAVITTVTGAPSGNMRGSSWGARAFEYESVVSRIIQHALPDSAAMTAQVAGEYLIYFEFSRWPDKDPGEAAYTRNGYTSLERGYTEAIRLDRVILWNGTTAVYILPPSESGPTTYIHS